MPFILNRNTVIWSKEKNWLYLIIILGTFLRLYHLDFQSLWMDEIYTMNISSPQYSLKELYYKLKVEEGFPFLYFYLLRIFYFLFGYSAIVARALSAMGGIASIWVLYFLVKELYNKNVGLIAAALLAFNGFEIYYSQEARPYSLQMFTAILGFYCLVKYIKRSSLKNAILFGIAAGFMLNLNFFSLLLFLSQCMLLLIVLAGLEREKKGVFFKNSFIGCSIACLMFLPNLKKLFTLSKIASFWIPTPENDNFSFIFKELLGNSDIVFFIFIGILIYCLTKIFNTSSDLSSFKIAVNTPASLSLIILTFWFACYFIAFYIKTFISTPLTLSRYYISILPVILIFFALGIQFIKNYVAKVILLFFVMGFSLLHIFIKNKYYSLPHKSQYREVSQFIEKNNITNVTVYTSLKNMYSYYLKDKMANTLIENTLEGHIKEMMSDSTKITPFWYADAHVRPYTLSPDYEAFLSKHFTLDRNFNGFDAWTRYYSLKNGKSQLDIKKFLPLKNTNGNDAIYNFDSFNFDGSVLITWGWAFIASQDAVDSRISLVLIKDNIGYYIDTQSINRSDVTASRQNKFDLDNSGFEAKQKLTNILNPGVYTLGIYIKNSTHQTESLIVTDKTVTLP
ncbi:glycosyltransferase family 39 protein [Flavobacterium rhizosphaerae]|uniref:Glycosyltransferase family 39 protein n=1 Tax=Flavobacterium rhizosphaerae TaxID=3163298 RepID=A0ABW8YYY1_9FLAO